MSSERKHTSEQKMQKTLLRREDKIKVTLRRDEVEVEVVGTPEQVGRLLQAADGGQRTAASSSGGSRPLLSHKSQGQRTATSSSGGLRPLLSHKSQKHGTSLVRSDSEHRSSQTGSRIQPQTSEVVQHVHSTATVRSTSKTSSSTYHCVTTHETYASRSNVEPKDGLTKNGRLRQGCLVVGAIKTRSG